MKLAHYMRGLDALCGDEALVHPVENDLALARGDSALADADAPIESPLPGVDDLPWVTFVRLMVAAPFTEVSQSNNLGMFQMTPRRLADLGVVERLSRAKHPVTRRTIWVANFVAPLTSDAFLRSPQVQYWCFARSMCDYTDRMEKKEIERPSSMSKAGALAILHRAGPNGLKTWTRNDRYPETEAAFERVEGVF